MNVVCVNSRKEETIELSEVLYFEAFGDDLFCVTMDGSHKTRLKLYEVNEFSHYGFVRINKSYSVNVFKIITLTPLVNSRLKLRMKNNTVLYVNRTYLKAFKTYLKKGEYKND